MMKNFTGSPNFTSIGTSRRYLPVAFFAWKVQERIFLYKAIKFHNNISKQEEIFGHNSSGDGGFSKTLNRKF